MLPSQQRKQINWREFYVYPREELGPKGDVVLKLLKPLCGLSFDENYLDNTFQKKLFKWISFEQTQFWFRLFFKQLIEYSLAFVETT